MNLKDLNINKTWTLFLDRDGVINRLRENDYVKNWNEFEFLPGVKESIAGLSKIFGRIVVVTNQQGIGKGLYTAQDLNQIHSKMISAFEDAGGKIDRIYFAPALEIENSPLRKPNTGMAELAVSDFPDIQLKKSIMVGDSGSDMVFGKRAGMTTVFAGNKFLKDNEVQKIDYRVADLFSFWNNVKNLITLNNNAPGHDN